MLEFLDHHPGLSVDFRITETGRVITIWMYYGKEMMEKSLAYIHTIPTERLDEISEDKLFDVMFGYLEEKRRLFYEKRKAD